MITGSGILRDDQGTPPAPTPTVGVSLIIFQRGGLRDGQYRFEDCAAALAAAPDYCDLVILCEARKNARRGGDGKYGFINTLALTAGRPLVCELGVCDRGEFGPILVYDPTILDVDTFHGYGTPLPHRDRIDLCNMFVRATGAKLGVLAVHWDYQSGDQRLAEAHPIRWIAGATSPMVVAGDMNGVATGGRTEVRRNFRTMPPHTRLHKGRWHPGRWWRQTISADARVLDFLLGTWKPSWRDIGRPRKLSRRRDGIGLIDLAEIAAYNYGEPDALLPTAHPHVDGGSSLRIDRALANPAGADMLVPGSFRVEAADDGFPDRRIVRFQLRPDENRDSRRDSRRRRLDRTPAC
jgi:hypothetical protein